uniref:DELTA-thalatoxin-Avl1a-like n=1 Tax=Dromaius novaehollandiae TaxID=8790 RepID=A0A8C4P521_DRONO|nr:DELTA-thalatoxin-Avl1a-like [Dromaius novaehollandiae]
MAEGFEHSAQDVGRSVLIEITNNVEHVTLRNPRSYCFSGHSHHPPPVQIPPGTVGKCIFVKRSYSLRGSVGVLVYEADTFSLAIMFSNPFDYNLYYIEFGLKLTPSNQQLQNMEELFRNMMETTPPQELTTFQKMKLSHSQAPLQVTMDNIRVTATMSNAAKAVLTILLEEKSRRKP